jgi:hypothetical protein
VDVVGAQQAGDLLSVGLRRVEAGLGELEVEPLVERLVQVEVLQLPPPITTRPASTARHLITYVGFLDFNELPPRTTPRLVSAHTLEA